MRTEAWFNLIFVNLDPNAEPLLKSLSQLATQAEGFGFDGMKLFERRTYDMKCNWKTFVDNYLEGYHLPSVHPGLNRELDDEAYTVSPMLVMCASSAQFAARSPVTRSLAAIRKPAKT